MKKFLLVLFIMTGLANVAVCKNDFKEPTDEALVLNYVTKEYGVSDDYEITVDSDSEAEYIDAMVKRDGEPYKYCSILRTYAERIYLD